MSGIFGGAARGALFHVQNVQASGVGGAALTAGAWRTRVINTELFNGIAGASLAANQITLPAGIYECRSWQMAYATYYSNVRLYNVTDAATALLGGSGFIQGATTVVNVPYPVDGRFEIAAAKVFEFQFICNSGSGNEGSAGGNGVSEIYLDAMFWRVR